MRPKAPRIVLMILCAIAVGALSQCKMTPDKVTGVAGTLSQGAKAKNESHSDCFSRCADAASRALDKEDRAHDKNLKKCRGDAGCISDENARHEAALAQIQEDERHCLDGCHHQGGGHGH